MCINSAIIDSYGRQYRRDSIDRFGDDLTELILSFMSFEDQTRLQFVCRQWQRLIFEKTCEVRIVKEWSLTKMYRRIVRFDKSCTTRAKISCLRNCRNIRSVSLKNVTNKKELSLIGQYCPHIRALDYRKIDVRSALPFFRDYGHKLEELHLILDYKLLKKFLDLCPNLKKVQVNDSEVLLTEGNDFLPQLEHVVSRLYIYSGNIHKFHTFANKYSQTLKHLSAEISNELSGQSLKTCIEYISRFDNLQQLDLMINYRQNIQTLNCLSLIGQGCTKLVMFHVIIYYELPMSKQFFYIFLKFKTLKRLTINFETMSRGQ